MATAHVVIGMNYGDEGKGLMVDYLVSQYGGSVVRFNGSAQAGHTVVTPEDDRHVFHHFGSGTFLGAPTILNKHFLVHPMLYRDEYTELRGFKPVVMCSDACPVVTPFDVVLNQVREASVKHGSCGVGVYDAIKRHESIPLTVGYLRARTKAEFLVEMRKCASRAKNIIATTGYVYPILLDYTEEISNRFYEDFMFFIDTLTSFKEPEHVIFEGAQGLLLDQEYGVMPHCTPTACGLENICLNLFQYEKVEVIYVTRSYLTRHGNGPLEGECDLGLADKTNVAHAYQGEFRYATLNHVGPCLVDFGRYANYNCQLEVAVTHLDEYDDGLWKSLNPKYTAYGETRNTVKVG
jgi:adenylosuccinate synthase